MQIAATKIDDPVPCGILDKGVADIPLLRDRPIECICAGWHFVDCEIDVLAETTECFTHPVAGNAAADRENITCEGEDLLANRWTVKALNHRLGNPVQAPAVLPLSPLTLQQLAARSCVAAER